MTQDYKRKLKAIEEKFASHKKLTEDFISESIKTEDPAGLCFSTSFPLLIYLASKQIKSVLITAKVPKEKSGNPNFKVDHYFLKIDNDGTILDPTIQQFNIDAEPIYIGKPIDFEVTKKYELCELPFKNWFPESHESWSKPYVDTTYPINEPFEKRSIMYTLKLATTLHTEIKNTKSIDELTNEYFGLYFKPIYIFLYNWHMGNIDFEIEKEKLPRCFNNLLSDALQWAKNERTKHHR